MGPFTDLRGHHPYFHRPLRGYRRVLGGELTGAPHNLIRHPHMPEAVFGHLWETIKSGRPWMGIVQNRCKNGDHYWVDAYVTPLRAGEKIHGYESVRVAADRDQIERAQNVYQRLAQG